MKNNDKIKKMDSVEEKANKKLEYQCRGRVISIKKNNKDELYFHFRSNSQFICSENEIPGNEKFNIMFPVPTLQDPVPDKRQPRNPNCVAISIIVDVSANNYFYPHLTSAINEDATIIIEYDGSTPQDCALVSIKVGHDDA